jgi:hypothetical protein
MDILWPQNAKPLQICPTLPLPHPIHPLTQQAPTAETMEPPLWSFQHPRRYRTTADMINIWQRGSAFTTGPPTISTMSGPLWLPITPKISTWPLLKFQPPQPLLLLLLSLAWEKASPSIAYWLCWWTYPCLFFHIISGNSLCISKLFVK